MSALEFVQMIEKFPCLYNSELPEYARKDVTDVAWGQVAKEMDWSITECKEKWKNIRNGFVRSLKIYPGGGAKKPYYLYDAMQFVVPFINPGILTRPDKLRISSPQTELVECESEDAKEDDEVISSDVQEPVRKKIKIEINERCDEPEHSERVDHSPWTQNRMHDDESRKLFLISLVPDVNQLTDAQLRVFRIKVLLLLEELKSQRRNHSLDILEQYVKLFS